MSAWEAEALKARALGIRVVIFRFGHVLSTQGGLFSAFIVVSAARGRRGIGFWGANDELDTHI